MAIARALCAASNGLEDLLRFWAVLAFAMALPLAAHYWETSPQRDTADAECLNEATMAISRWHGSGHVEFTRTVTGTTVRLRVSAAEWSALTCRQRAAVPTLLRSMTWRGARVDHYLIRDEGGGTLLTG